jgi:hypothetical protein
MGSREGCAGEKSGEWPSRESGQEATSSHWDLGTIVEDAMPRARPHDAGSA